jgi:endonuclease/exonuclease/phosphatase family metal-dependent hydrolase
MLVCCNRAVLYASLWVPLQGAHRLPCTAHMCSTNAACRTTGDRRAQHTSRLGRDVNRGMLAATHKCVTACPLSEQGTAGYGLAVYYKQALQVVPVHLDKYTVWVRVCSKGSQLMVANVYVPLDQNKGMQVLEQVAQRAQQYRQSGFAVVVAGDLNAHVAGGDDRPLGADGAPVQSVCARAVRAGERVNRYGRAVLEMCRTAGLVLLTGRGAQCHSSAAVPDSYVLGNRSSRPDHVLVSLHMTGWVTAHSVRSDMEGYSDHLPLLTTLAVPAGQPQQGAAPPARGTQPRRLRWEVSKCEEYMGYVADSEAVAEQLDTFAQLLESGDLQAAVDALHGVVLGAGECVGMRVQTGQRAQRRTRVHKPWYDAECRAAKARVAALPRALKQDYRQLRALLQRKRRAWQLSQNSQLDEECAERGQKCLWRDMRRGVCRGVPDVCEVGNHRSHLAAWPSLLVQGLRGPWMWAGRPRQRRSSR